MRGDGRHTSPGFQVIKKRGMIKQIKEINFPEYATLSQAKVSISDMGDMSISAQVKIDGDIKPDFSYDWEVEFKGERYIQPYRSPQGTKDTSSICSTIDLTFYHKAEWLMRSQMFIEMSSTESGTAIADKYEASLGLSLPDFVTAFNRVLSHFFGDAIVMLLNPEGTYSTERKFVSISYSYIWDVLQKIYEIYDVRWRIRTDPDTGVFQILVGYPAEDVSHIFEYGFDGGLMSVQRQVQSSDIRNRLLGRGGEKNLPAYYFKQAPEDSLFESDPDWIPELASIYFSELRGKTFRDYVKGWKAKHYGGEPMAEPTEAYTAGYTDGKFDPIEYVDDKDSIEKYGVIIGGLGNNDDIYPSIQGAEGGVDILVDAEQATDDYTDETAENESQIINIEGDSKEASNVPKNTEVTLKVDDKIRHRFTVPEGYIGFIQVGDVSFKAYRSYKEYGVTVIDGITFVQQSLVTRIFNAGTDTEIPRDKFSNLDPGTYYWVQEITLLNASKYTAYKVKVTFNGLKLTIGKGEAGGWKPTFDIWVRNIWGTQKLASESDKAYADRVWLPILGDRLGNEAKVVFSSGWLSFSSDWEFTIVGYAYDTSKEGSEWRLTLQKSDAEQEATGKFIPNGGTNAAAGDSFFFIGIDMPYRYVLWAEQRLDDYKRDQLAELAQINPTWVVETDKVRLNQAESGGGVLADSLSAGCSLRLADKRFIDSAYLNLYIQSISYEWSESTVINPDIEIVLSDKPSAVINAVSQIQGDIEELNKNVTSLSSIKSEILAAIDRMYLRKDGLNDISLSRTEFRNLINGLGFKPGRIGGSGWGIYKDSVGKAVGEFDRIVVRDSIDVSSVSVEQVKHTSGTTIISEANIICTDVVEMSTDYRCYFDTKGDELPNMFKAGDIAWCLKYNQDSSRLKYYKRRVTEAGTDYISLSKTDKDGDGVPESGDSIVQFGSFTDTSRQSAIIINPHDGGSIEVYSGLNGYDVTERNMVGLGFSKATGKAFLYGYGEFFFGDRTLTDNFITFQQKEGDTKPNLYVNGNIIIGAGSSGLTNLSEWAGKQEQMDSATKGLADIDSDLVLTPLEKRSIMDTLGAISEVRVTSGAYEPWHFRVDSIKTSENFGRLEWKNGEWLDITDPGDIFVRIVFTIFNTGDTHFRFRANYDDQDSSDYVLISMPDDTSFVTATQEERLSSAYGYGGGGGAEEYQIDITGLSPGTHFIILQAHVESLNPFSCFFSIDESDRIVRGSLWDWYRRCLALDGDNKDYYQVNYADPAHGKAADVFSWCYAYKADRTDEPSEVPDTFRGELRKRLQEYEASINRLVAGTSDDDVAYLKKAFSDGETVISGGVVMSEAVAVRNSEGEVEGMLNGSENFEDGTHGKAIVISGIPSVSSSGSADLLSRVMEAETILFEDGTLKTKKLQAEAGTFSGVLKAVSGSFKSLSCLDADGNELGYISFGEEGTVDFTGFDLRHDGTFRSNNIFCRSTLGARSRTAVVITGTSGKYYYNGLENASDYVTVRFTSGTSGGNSFYYVPLYGTGEMGSKFGSQIAGMPVDLVIIQVSGTTTMRYCFTAPVGKKFTVVNANNGNNNIYIYSNGTAVQLNGGTACEIVNIGYANMLPSQTSDTLGGGQMIISKNDNNW